MVIKNLDVSNAKKDLFNDYKFVPDSVSTLLVCSTGDDEKRDRNRFLGIRNISISLESYDGA